MPIFVDKSDHTVDNSYALGISCGFMRHLFRAMSPYMASNTRSLPYTSPRRKNRLLGEEVNIILERFIPRSIHNDQLDPLALPSNR